MTDRTDSTSAGTPVSSPPRRSRGGGWRVLLGTLLTVGALAILGWQVTRAGPRDVLERVLDASPMWLAVAALLTTARFAVFAMRLSLITRRLTHCRTRGFLPIVLASQLVSLLLPGLRVGAALLRAQLAAKRFGGGISAHLGPNILDQTAHTIAWILVTAALAPLLIADRAKAWLEQYGGWLLPAGVVLVLVGIRVFQKAIPALLAWLEKPRPGRRGIFARSSARVLRDTGSLAADPVAVSGGIVGGVGFIAVSGLAQMAALIAIGCDVSFALATLAITLGTAAGTLAHSPGGLGITEAAQIGFLVSEGVPLEAATSGVLIARAMHYAVIVLAGLPALVNEWRLGNLRFSLTSETADPDRFGAG